MYTTANPVVGSPGIDKILVIMRQYDTAARYFADSGRKKGKGPVLPFPWEEE